MSHSWKIYRNGKVKKVDSVDKFTLRREDPSGYNCDICSMGPLQKYRWECTTCAEFDMCNDCVLIDHAKHNSKHTLVRVRISPKKAKPSTSRVKETLEHVTPSTSMRMEQQVSDNQLLDNFLRIYNIQLKKCPTPNSPGSACQITYESGRDAWLAATGVNSVDSQDSEIFERYFFLNALLFNGICETYEFDTPLAPGTKPLEKSDIWNVSCVLQGLRGQLTRMMLTILLSEREKVDADIFHPFGRIDDSDDSGSSHLVVTTAKSMKKILESYIDRYEGNLSLHAKLQILLKHFEVSVYWLVQLWKDTKSHFMKEACFSDGANWATFSKHFHQEKIAASPSTIRATIAKASSAETLERKKPSSVSSVSSLPRPEKKSAPKSPPKPKAVSPPIVTHETPKDTLRQPRTVSEYIDIMEKKSHLLATKLEKFATVLQH